MAGFAADTGEPPVTDEELRQLLLDTKVIAVVGLSANPDRPSNQVAWYLHHHGYRLFGVNPRCPEPDVFGVPMLPSLDQVGIRNDEALGIAEEAGLGYVEDRCLKVEHARLLGRPRRDG
jgi:uncharacterized protein